MADDLIGAVEALLEDRQSDLVDTETNTCVVAIDQLDIVLAAVRPLVKQALHAERAMLLAANQVRITAVWKAYDEMLGTAEKAQEQADRIAENAAHVEKVSSNGLDSMPPAPICGAEYRLSSEMVCTRAAGHSGAHLCRGETWT